MFRFLARTALLRYGPRLARGAWNAFKNRRGAAGARTTGRAPAGRTPEGTQAPRAPAPRTQHTPTGSRGR